MKRKNRWNKKQMILIVFVAVCVIVSVGILIYRQVQKEQNTIQSGGNIQPIEDEKIITYEGKKYQYNKELKNIVFFGVDKREEVEVQKYAGRGGQSDVILVLSMNEKEKTTQIVQVSRDSMVNLKIYDSEGTLLTEERGQIALQYAYGDGEKKSCRLARNAVSELLYGIPIDGYVSLNMDGVVTIVDTLGGIPITFEEDYTDVDPAYEKGATVTLDGAAAEKFVRYRDSQVTGSNNDRMERQTIFLQALLKSVKSYAQGENDYDPLLDSAEPFMVTDMKAEEMKALSEYKVRETIEKVPGETVQGEKHDEYIVDDKTLHQMILDLFYKEVEKE